MSNHQPNELDDKMKDLKALYGNPVLSTENEEAYNRILSGLLDCLRPSDFMEFRWMKQLADAIWDEVRYKRQKTALFDRKFRECREHQAKRKLEFDHHKAKGGNLLYQPISAIELEHVTYGHNKSVDAILARAPDELDHARALETGMDYYDKLDKWLETAMARQREVIGWFEMYRNGLGPRLRKVSNEIIAVECATIDRSLQEAESTSLVPTALSEGSVATPTAEEPAACDGASSTECATIDRSLQEAESPSLVPTAPVEGSVATPTAEGSASCDGASSPVADVASDSTPAPDAVPASDSTPSSSENA